MYLRHALLVSAFSCASLAAQDGGQLYSTYCSACHAEDGRGATGGAFPPLSGSPWVTNAPELPVKIVLHGLHGPIEIFGKTYDLEMPPQGAVLADDQIAAISSYIRSSWGNKAEPITPEFVASLRKAHSDRKTPWTAAELQEKHPLPAEVSALQNLTSRVYLGQWKDLPDFDKIQPENVEEEHDGIISVTHSMAKDHFGLVWEGDFMAPEDGEYTFRLDADDGARVIINRNTIVEVRELGPHDGSRAKQGSIKLTKGPNPIRIEYFEFNGNEGISLGWKGPGVKNWKWLSDKSGKPPQSWPDIPIIPADGRTAIFRNFIEGTTPRAIGIGFPAGANLAWSADHFAPELVWRGAFMDGGRHWTDRGQGNQAPAGEDIVKLTKSPALAIESEVSATWPDHSRLKPRFRGYKLDPAGNPTFAVELNGSRLLDHYAPSGSSTLVRSITLAGKPGEKFLLLLSNDAPVSAEEATRFQIGDQLTIQTQAPVRLIGGNTLVLQLQPGITQEIRYIWR